MSPTELVTLITALSITISKDKSDEEINLLSVIFTQLGDTLATIATQRECLESNSKDSSTVNGSATEQK